MNPKRSPDYALGYLASRDWHKYGPEHIYTEPSTAHDLGWNAYVRDRRRLTQFASIVLRLVFAASILAAIWIGYVLLTI